MRGFSNSFSKATLSDGKGGRLELQFNPESVTVKRGSNTSSRTKDNHPWVSERQYQITSWNATKFVLSEVLFAGPSTRADVNQLQRWLEPDWGTGSTVKGDVEADFIGPLKPGQTRKGTSKVWYLPVLRFVWGSKGLNERVELDSLNATYTRFTADGMPVRAKATITLHVMNMNLHATNPTSGGQPGRHSSTIVQGQSLQSLAQNSYGSPSHWRQVAALNSIEDPLRVRPGTVVYLPNRGELSEGGSR